MDDKTAALLGKVEGVLISGQSGSTILVAAQLEHDLLTLLRRQMPKLSRTTDERLFEYPGPLSSFSSKIAVAYGLGLIPQSVQLELDVIRAVRNTFAHSEKKLSLTSPEIVKELSKAKGWKSTVRPVEFYGKLAQRTKDGLIAATEARVDRLEAELKALVAANKALAEKISEHEAKSPTRPKAGRARKSKT
jgi:DNA-binding MltR family transcriptional regulator